MDKIDKKLQTMKSYMNKRKKYVKYLKMDKVKEYMSKNDVSIDNIANSFQSNIVKFKSKINNISINNNNNNSQEDSETQIRARSISTKSITPGIFREFSNSLFSSNKENYNSNTNNLNDKKNFNLNAKDVSRVSGFVANNPLLAKKGLQAAAYLSGDKETAKKIGQTNTKEITDTASRINKTANFYSENQNTINEVTNKFNRNTNNTLPVNKFNSSAISNSSSNSAVPGYSTPTSTSTSSSKPGIAVPPPLPGRIHADSSLNRNSTVSVASRSTGSSVSVNRSNTVGSHTSVGSKKINKAPPPPIPNCQPDYIKMHEAITNTNITASPKTVAAPPPLPNRPFAAKLKRTGSDSNINGQNASISSLSSSVSRNSTIGNGSINQTSQSYQMEMNNKIAIEIHRVFNIDIPQENISRYSNVFSQVEQNNYIAGSIVKALWIQSGIPKNTLAKIWTFVNKKMNGLLGKTEFITGMYLIDQYLNGCDIEHYFQSHSINK